MFVTGKLTALPQYGYYSITVLSGAELALAESAVWNYPVTNSGTISGGVFQGELENRGTVSGGTLQGTVENTPVGHIRGGTFLSNLTNSGYIHDGTFQGNVTNAYNGFIEGGTFSCFQLINEFRISGGTFRCMVTNNSVIEGGTFPNAVINSALGTIDGGEFSFYIQNNGTVAKAKLLGSLMGNDPQAVIHSVNGLDTPLGYGKDLLSELGAAPAGTAWYAGDTYISGGAVPLVYTEYTTKAHTNYVAQVTDKNGSEVGKYPTLDGAIAAAPEGGTVTLLQDEVRAETVTLEKGITLDLNGNTLIADAFDGAVLGNGFVVDSQNGQGLLKTDTLLLKENNPHIPFKDAEGYRLFGYSLTLDPNPEQVDGSTYKFWYRFTFACNDAYGLIAAGNTGLTVGAQLTWNGTPVLQVLFGAGELLSADQFVMDWAAVMLEKDNIWLYVNITGLDTLRGGTLGVRAMIHAEGVSALVPAGAADSILLHR